MKKIFVVMLAVMFYFVQVPFSLAQAPAPVATMVVAQPGAVPVAVSPDGRVSLDYTRADLASVLKAISYSLDLNMVISNKVDGLVSVQLKDVTLDDALDAILDMNGYGYTRKENIVYIIPLTEMDMSVDSIFLKHLLAKDAQELLAKSLSSRGDMKINVTTNSLIVMDDPESLAKLKTLAEQIDVPPLQVLIEARIIDISTTDAEELGTTLSATYTPVGEGHLPGISYDSAIPAAGASGTNGAQLSLTPRFNRLSANMTLTALVQKGKARVVASPSIATLSGLEAKIIIGDRIPYQSSTTEITLGADGEAASQSTSTSETKFVEVGTQLRVTPMVSSDGWITMKIHPEVSTFVKMVGDTPQTATREADATIRVRDNETIVIGGLIQKRDEVSNDGVPGLSSIPGLGWLFKRHTMDRGHSELIVVITPHIIRSSNEMPLEKGQVPSEVYIDTTSTGQDQDLLSGLFVYVDDLEKDILRKPSDGLYLSTELLKTYQTIQRLYPQSGKADYCLYKIITLYVREFEKCEAAQASLKALKDGFPNSPYLGPAELLANSCVTNSTVGQ